MRWKNVAINKEIKCAAVEHGFIFPAHKLTKSFKRETSWLFLVTYNSYVMTTDSFFKKHLNHSGSVNGLQAFKNINTQTSGIHLSMYIRTYKFATKHFIFI